MTRDALHSCHCTVAHAVDRKENNIGPGNLGLEQPAPILDTTVMIEERRPRSLCKRTQLSYLMRSAADVEKNCLLEIEGRLTLRVAC